MCALNIKFKIINISGDRAMSPAQSEDSGLAADRGTTYATISLPRDNAPAMGIELLGKLLRFEASLLFGNSFIKK